MRRDRGTLWAIMMLIMLTVLGVLAFAVGAWGTLILVEFLT